MERTLTVGDGAVIPVSITDGVWSEERVYATIAAIDDHTAPDGVGKLLLLKTEDGAQFGRADYEVCLDNVTVLAKLKEQFGEVSQVNSEIFQAAVNMGATDELLHQLALGYPAQRRTEINQYEPLKLAFIEDLWDLDIPHDMTFKFLATLCFGRGPKSASVRADFWNDLRAASFFTPEQMMRLVFDMCEMDASATFTKANMEKLASWLRCKGLRRYEVGDAISDVTQHAVKHLSNFTEKYQFDAFATQANAMTIAMRPGMIALTQSGWNLLVVGMALQLGFERTKVSIGKSIQHVIATQPHLAPLVYRGIITGSLRIRGSNRQVTVWLRELFESAGWRFSRIGRKKNELGAVVQAPSGYARFVCMAPESDASLKEGDEVMVDSHMIPQVSATSTRPSLPMMPTTPLADEVVDALQEILSA